MIPRDATPIEHRPPRRPINLRPVWPAPQPREHWEIQIDAMAQAQALARGERMWRVLVDVARNPGGPVSKPVERAAQHGKDCGYWTDQYPWECDCGVVSAKVPASLVPNLDDDEYESCVRVLEAAGYDVGADAFEGVSAMRVAAD